MAPHPRIGCSGWQYKHWKGVFYPSGLQTSSWFEQYSSLFDTVEINNSFYRLPEAETFARWRVRAPEDFIYAVKASRFLTHMKKLKDPEEPLDRLFSRLRELGPTLGPVLYQLPTGWKLDLGRLEHFLQVLPDDASHVVEFRDPSWYRDDVFSLLEKHRVSLCVHDMHGSATGRVRVGPLVYVRFHGAAGKYHGGYGPDRLRRWADWLDEQHAAGAPVFAYFNNDVGAHAPRDATTLRRLVDRMEPAERHTARDSERRMRA